MRRFLLRLAWLAIFYACRFRRLLWQRNRQSL